MAKKKKVRMMTLSDKDYEEYIMSLKDARPTKVIVPDQKKDN